MSYRMLMLIYLVRRDRTLRGPSRYLARIRSRARADLTLVTLKGRVCLGLIEVTAVLLTFLRTQTPGSRGGNSGGPRPPKLEIFLNTASLALIVTFLAGLLLAVTGPYHTDQRALGSGIRDGALLLTLPWELLAVGLAAFRWHATGFRFRTTLAINSLIVCLLLSLLFR